MKLIYFAPVDRGGLAQYAVHQAAALEHAGAEVYFLGQDHMRENLASLSSKIQFIEIVPTYSPKSSISIVRRLAKATSIVRDTRSQIRQIKRLCETHGINHLLISYYFEYFSPLWTGPLTRLQRSGVKIGTVVHDPVRDFRIGPDWWHQWSISKAYSFVDVAYTHDDVKLDTGRPHRQLEQRQIPHGLYEVPAPNRPLAANVDLAEECEDSNRPGLRSELGIPDSVLVALSFGHIRDGKNLDLMIQSMKDFPDLHLLVAGREQSDSQKSVSWYQDLAGEMGVEDRCHWVNRFVTDSEIHRFFQASDFAVMLYSSDFQSASGVLNNTAQFELPILCSSGGGPLRMQIQNYNLGLWVEPDRIDLVKDGLRNLLDRLPLSDQGWQRYREEHDWNRNATTILKTLCKTAPLDGTKA